MEPNEPGPENEMVERIRRQLREEGCTCQPGIHFSLDEWPPRRLLVRHSLDCEWTTEHAENLRPLP